MCVFRSAPGGLSPFPWLGSELSALEFLAVMARCYPSH